MSTVADDSRPVGLSPLEIKRALNRNIVAGGLGTFFGVCIWPQFLTTFVLLLGGNAFHVGLVTTLPLLAFPSQIASAWLVERLNRRKEFWFITASLHRCLWFVIAGLAFWAGHGLAPWQIGAFFVLFFLSNALGSLSVPPWFSWMADLVPREEETRFWTRRAKWHQLVAISGVLLGRLADTFPAGALWPYGLLFTLAAVAGQLDLIVHKPIPEPAPVRGHAPPSWLGLLEPVRDQNFRWLLLRMCLVTFTTNFSNAFLVLFFLKSLAMNQWQISLVTAVMLVARMMIARFWGFLGDRFGNQPVSLVCECALVLFPVAFLFVSRENPFAWVLLIHGVAGLFNVGSETSVNGLMLSLSPTRNKSLFIAMFFSLTGVVGALGPMAGSAFLEWLNQTHWVWAGHNWDAFDALFLTAGLLRLATLPVSFRVREPLGRPTGMLVRRLLESNPFRVVHHSYLLNDPSDVAARVRSVEELADARSAIATADLLSALRDASLEVRRESARALGRIGDAEAVDGLVSALGTPELLIADEAARALGRIRDTRAIPALIAAVQEVHSRREAVIALGEIGDVSARQTLADLLDAADSDAGTRVLCAEALGRIGDPADVARVVDLLLSTEQPVARRQLTLAVAAFLGSDAEAYETLGRELRVPGDRVLRAVRAATDRHKAADPFLRDLLCQAGWNYEAAVWGRAAWAFLGATTAIAGEAESAPAEELWREREPRPTATRSREQHLAHVLTGAVSTRRERLRQEDAVLAFLIWRSAHEREAQKADG